MNVPGVESRPSPIAGLGLFAVRAFVAGERIVPYEGSLTTQPPDPGRPGAATYLLEIEPGRWLDGSAATNPARHANHACHPNAELVYDPTESRAWLTALHPLEPGTEITFDYGFSMAESLFQPCRCGAADCIGRILATPLRGASRRHLRFSRPRD
jgi:SET domain-containing protein